MKLHELKERLLGRKVKMKQDVAGLREGDIVEIIRVDTGFIYAMVKSRYNQGKQRKAIGYTHKVLRGECDYAELIEGILPTGERILSCQRTS